MPKFNKNVNELESRFDKWLFVIKNLHRLEKIPEKLQEKIFLQVFASAEIAKFTRKEYQAYEDSLKYYRDLKNSLDTAKEEGLLEGIKRGIQKGRQEGIKEGIKEGKIEDAVKMLEKGLDSTLISEITGLPEEELEKLQEYGQTHI